MGVALLVGARIDLDAQRRQVRGAPGDCQQLACDTRHTSGVIERKPFDLTQTEGRVSVIVQKDGHNTMARGIYRAPRQARAGSPRARRTPSVDRFDTSTTVTRADLLCASRKRERADLSQQGLARLLMRRYVAAAGVIERLAYSYALRGYYATVYGQARDSGHLTELAARVLARP